MDPNEIATITQATALSLGKIGAAGAVCLAAVGSAMGIGYAGAAATGAWKKCFVQGKPAPFLLFVFVGAPITQTFYGMILMFHLIKLATAGTDPYALIAWGVLGGLAIGASAAGQGRVAAAACDAQADTGQGFANYLMALGIVESVAIFVMVFILISA